VVHVEGWRRRHKRNRAIVEKKQQLLSMLPGILILSSVCTSILSERHWIFGSDPNRGGKGRLCRHCLSERFPMYSRIQPDAEQAVLARLYHDVPQLNASQPPSSSCPQPWPPSHHVLSTQIRSP